MRLSYLGAIPRDRGEVREEHKRLGIKILTDDWSRYHANRAIVETPMVTREMLDQVVIAWEEEFNERLGEIKVRMGTGDATEEEASLLTNLEHTVLIYDLMMDHIIEKQGCWRNGGKPLSAPDAFKILVDRVVGATGLREAAVSSSLAPAVECGNLSYEEKHGQIQWRWADYI